MIVRLFTSEEAKRESSRLEMFRMPGHCYCYVSCSTTNSLRRKVGQLVISSLHCTTSGTETTDVTIKSLQSAGTTLPFQTTAGSEAVPILTPTTSVTSIPYTWSTPHPYTTDATGTPIYTKSGAAPWNPVRVASSTGIIMQLTTDILFTYYGLDATASDNTLG